jgi:cytochrome c553
MKLFATLIMAASMAIPAFFAIAADEKPAAAAPAPAGAAATPAAASLPAHDAAAAPKAAKPDLAKGAASFGGVCAACHNADGNSVIAANPKLAQQHPEYLLKQLQEFKAGKRENAIMKGFASALSDEDMRNIAYWAASQKATPGFAKDKELVALGERIYRGGIADRQVPACAGCHSPNGAGIPAQFPRLAGQHAEYAVAQLTAFRDGVRKNSVQMTQVAAKLNDREIRAVADYVAGLH